jgi:hypothetical protein
VAPGSPALLGRAYGSRFGFCPIQRCTRQKTKEGQVAEPVPLSALETAADLLAGLQLAQQLVRQAVDVALR